VVLAVAEDHRIAVGTVPAGTHVGLPLQKCQDTPGPGIRFCALRQFLFDPADIDDLSRVQRGPCSDNRYYWGNEVSEMDVLVNCCPWNSLYVSHKFRDSQILRSIPIQENSNPVIQQHIFTIPSSLFRFCSFIYHTFLDIFNIMWF